MAKRKGQNIWVSDATHKKLSDLKHTGQSFNGFIIECLEKLGYK